MSRKLTVEEVARHNSADDCWLIIDGKVYDVTGFLKDHPGGQKVVIKEAGKDATDKFNMLHNQSVLKRYGEKLLVGSIGSSGDGAQSSTVSVPGQPTLRYSSKAFGEGIPMGDPCWYQDWHSPYYNESHIRLRKAMREFVEKEVKPYTFEWDAAGQIPRELFVKCANANWLGGVCGPPWPTEYAGTDIIAGIKPEEFDSFHELIMIDEMSRAGSGGVVWGVFAGLSIGLPPVLHFGSKYLKDKVCRACLTGEKVICLAITEPYAGSDVANLKTSAVKSADGKHFVVNGEKKWITNGVFADYFTTAVRTGGPGMGGVSLLLIERSMPGVTTRQMKCSGVWPSGTTYITFEDVKVPVENLIGVENQGFKCIMYNFNHERLGVIIQATRLARVCYEEAFRYAHKRKTFGKRLIDHPVIRMKLAHMARQIEATHSWLETMCYQTKMMSHAEASIRLGGPMALLKAQATVTFEYCAREASQIFGGLAYTREGQGGVVERLYREVRAYAIPAGSEEIMLDLGVRQAMKLYAANL